MTSFEVIYNRFLSATNLDFPGLEVEEVQEILFNWTMTASSKFMFPRVSLELVQLEKDNPEGLEPGNYFKGDLTEKEITVIIELMKETQLLSALADEEKFQLYYNDANLKLPSQSGLITQLNRAVDTQRRVAKETQDRYYRTSPDNKPTIGSIWMP